MGIKLMDLSKTMDLLRETKMEGGEFVKAVFRELKAADALQHDAILWRAAEHLVNQFTLEGRSGFRKS